MTATPPTPAVPPPTEDEWLGYFDSLSNWGRWGADDVRGTLNLVTPDVVRTATALVSEGLTISCAREVGWGSGFSEDKERPQHFMSRTGTAARPTGADGGSDWVVLPMHGLVMTHLDAPSHMFWNGRMYNGQEASAVTAERGARLGSIEPFGNGVVGRGVLLDVARALDVDCLEPEHAISPDELDAAAARQSVEVRPGDILMVRTGYGAARTQAPWPAGTGPYPQDMHPHLPGLGPSCLPWMREHDVAVVGTDTGTDARPSAYSFLAPFHVVAMTAIGMWIIDNLELEAVAQNCERLGRWEFLVSVAPIRLKYSTGAPVNPIAIF
jgi:kynurenine formamidase